jgi:hypothetical protein
VDEIVILIELVAGTFAPKVKFNLASLVAVYSKEGTTIW